MVAVSAASRPAGDVVSLSLPMAVRRVVADERVVDDRGKVALERGPLVYCAEGIDTDLVIPDEAPFEIEPRRDLLGGIDVLRATVTSGGGQPRSLLAIPYYAWSHRGAGEMAVWLSRKASTTPPPRD